MLLKLLKNDLKAVFKYWWISAIISIALSFFGSFLIGFLRNYDGYSPLLGILSILGIMLVIGGLSAFALLSFIFVIIRFYRNFFTDEGYLTFTLPVKRNELFLSKFITGIFTSFATGTVLVIDVCIILFLGMIDDKSFWKALGSLIESLPDLVTSYWLHIIEIAVIGVGMTLLSLLLIFACVTFSSIVIKKAKVFWAIMIYYGVTSLISLFFQVCFSFGGVWLVSWIAEFSAAYIKSLFALFLFVVILFIASGCLGLYILNHWMLDKKLNLN